MNKIINEYLNNIEKKIYDGIAVVGSYSTGFETELSDVDLIFLVKTKMETKIEIYQNKYFVSNYYTKNDLDEYFTKPNLILNGLDSFSKMSIIYDKTNILSKIKEQTTKFLWTNQLVDKSIKLGVVEFISYLEEVQKSIQGLKDKHVGKMLNGVHGLSYGMFNVLRLTKQIKISSDNDFYSSVIETLEDFDPIIELSEYAFGIKKTTLEEQVEAGLEMFMFIGNSMMSLFNITEKKYVIKLITEIIKLI